MSRTQLIKTYNKNTDWTWQSIYTSLKTIIRQVTDPRVLQLFATSNAKTYKKNHVSKTNISISIQCI